MARFEKVYKKVAVPVVRGELCVHFGQSDLFYIFETTNDEIISMIELKPPEHANGVYPKWLKEQGVTDVITGGIGQKAIDIFLDAGINVFDGAPVKEPEALVLDFLNGRLESLGNYCDH